MDLSLDLVQKMIASAVGQAQSEFKRPVCLAICDSHGLLVAFMRMPGATLRSVPISQAKAYTSAYTGLNTDAFAARLEREKIPSSFFSDDRLTGLTGGVVLKNSAGEVIGGLGVSGLTPPEDLAVALKAAELFNQA